MKTPLKIYEYNNCSTCKKALKFLDSKKISYTKIPIVEQPPSLAELKQMLTFLKAEGKTFKNLFNTSGIQYREQNISKKIKDGMTEAEALKLVSQNGKLIKRPFLIAAQFGGIGFQEDVWKKFCC
jgi:arsenate reductase (glutaredoxin)